MSALIEMRQEHSLYVRIGDGKNLKALDRGGTSDPYVLLSGMGGGQVTRTKTFYKELSPFWGEEHFYEVSATMKELKVEVWDENSKKDAIIGVVKIPKSNLISGKVIEQWYPLQDENTKDYVSGEMHCTVHYLPPDDVIPGKLKIKVINARNLASKDSNGLSDPFFKIKYNGEKQKTKPYMKTLNPDVNQEFEINVPPGGPDEVNISVWDYDKLSSNDFMGAVTLYLSELTPDYLYDEWYQLCAFCADANDQEDRDQKQADLGQIRLKIVYKEERILPMEQYASFLELLKAPKQGIIHALGECKIDRNAVATHLIRIFEVDSYDATVDLLKALNEDEVEKTSEAHVLFRGNSIATKANDMYMKMVAIPYLHSTLKIIIKRIYDSNDNCEVDPTRLTEDDDLEKNWGNLLVVMGSVCDAIFNSADNCPTYLRSVMGSLRQCVKDKWPDEETVPYTAISGFVFLRFFCAAILGPKLFDLADDHPQEQRTARTLTLVSKTVQNLANLCEFGGKEPYMARMNEFIVANMDRCRAFLDAICTVPEEEFTAHDAVLIDGERETASLVTSFEDNREALEKINVQAKNEDVVKLFSVLDSIAEVRETAVVADVKSAIYEPASVLIPPPPNDIPVTDLVAEEKKAKEDEEREEREAKQRERKENMKKILDVQANLSKCDVKKNLASRDRVFLREAKLCKTSKGKDQDRNFYLFNDMLLYGEIKKGKPQINFKGMIPVDKMVVVDPSLDGTSKNAFTLINLNKKKAITISCASETEAKAWMNDLSRLTRDIRGQKALDEASQKIAKKAFGQEVKEYAPPRVPGEDAPAGESTT